MTNYKKHTKGQKTTTFQTKIFLCVHGLYEHMSDVFLYVIRGVINVNKFEVRLLLSSHLKK